MKKESKILIALGATLTLLMSGCGAENAPSSSQITDRTISTTSIVQTTITIPATTATSSTPQTIVTTTPSSTTPASTALQTTSTTIVALTTAIRQNKLLLTIFMFASYM